MKYDFVCPTCSRDFANRASLVTHKKRHKFNTKFYNCSFCNYKTESKQVLGRHSKAEHKEENVDKICKLCNFEAKDVEAIEKHLIVGHKEETNKRTCEQCQFTAFHEPTMSEHMTIHEGNNCKLCAFRGNSKMNLRKHLHQMHGREQIQCSLCEFSTTSNPVIRKHAKDAHGTKYEHVCDVCGKDFPKKCDLEYHKQSHSAHKGVRCNLCTFETKHVALIKRHWMHVHKSGTQFNKKNLA